METFHHGVTMSEVKTLGEAVKQKATGVICLCASGSLVSFAGLEPKKLEREIKDLRKKTDGGDETLSTSLAEKEKLLADYKSENSSKFYLVQNFEEAKKVFGGAILSFLEVIFLESTGPVCAFATADKPTKEDIDRMSKAFEETGVLPNIFIAPEVSSTHALYLADKARDFGGLAIVDLPFSERETMKADNPFCYYVVGNLKSGSKENPFLPASAAVSGLMRAQPYWISPSNRKFLGVVAIENSVGWALVKDESSSVELESDRLNQQNKTAFIYAEGFRPWGNRMGGGEFVSVYRLKQAVKKAIADSMQWAVDNNITIALVMAVTESVNNFLRDLTTQGAILGGNCFASPSDNPPDKIKDGIVKFNFDLTPSYPAEQIRFSMKIENERLKEIF